MATPTKLNTLCSLLMASLFAYSASVQLNDSGTVILLPFSYCTVYKNPSKLNFSISFFLFLDWYFWFSLYGGASVVNLVNWAISSKAIKHVAEGALWLGIFLFIRVIAESTLVDGVTGFWSLDLSERVIREKIGSGLVIISMILQLTASSLDTPPHKQQSKFPRYVEYGEPTLPASFFSLLLGISVKLFILLKVLCFANKILT